MIPPHHDIPGPTPPPSIINLSNPPPPLRKKNHDFYSHMCINNNIDMPFKKTGILLQLTLCGYREIFQENQKLDNFRKLYVKKKNIYLSNFLLTKETSSFLSVSIILFQRQLCRVKLSNGQRKEFWQFLCWGKNTCSLVTN